MTRYFYTDPLAAAWMAKHFGVQFISDAGAHVKIMTDSEMFYVPNEHSDTDKAYIHADSLYLLEPQPNDIMTWDLYEGKEYGQKAMRRIKDGDNCEAIWSDVFHDETGTVSHTKIIQRGGVAFHWPESEVA